MLYYNTFMEKIKQSSVAGTFYPANVNELRKQIDSFKENNKNTYEVPARAVIVPHAGLVFSGRLAYEGISQLDKNIKNIFIIAPAHRVGFSGLGLSSFDFWETPLGKIELNQQIIQELNEKFGADYQDDAIAPEHAIEIEVPIIQSVFDNVKIVPILVGNATPDKIEEIFSYYYQNPENGFIISSDLSHYLKHEDAVKIDTFTAQLIENGICENFTPNNACGVVGILGLIKFANKNRFSLIRIDTTNSSSVTGDTSKVVGYGTWFLFEGEKNTFLKEYYSDFILDLCKRSLNAQFDSGRLEVKFPKVFAEGGACFVTLEKNNQLRGCIGSIIPHRSLIEDIVINAQHAAFKDYRFNPVTKEEIPELQIAVSLLSIPQKISFKDEVDLMEQIRPYNDGIIIRDGNHQSVYLPSVWEQLPDKKDFLRSLKVKAGLAPDYFSNNFEAYRFETVYIK